MSKRERKAAPSFSNFGFSTILLAFVMICIVTIAALSLLTANSDYKLSQKVAEKNTAFYAAQQQAYEHLSHVDDMLAQAYNEAIDANSYYQNVAITLQTLQDGTYEPTTNTYSYQIPISENQNLKVELSIHYPTHADKGFYQISAWKSVYDEIEIDEETLDLID